MTDSQKISISSSYDNILNYQKAFGGTITEAWGNHLLTVNNNDVRGTVRYVNFRRSIHLIIFDLTFSKDITLQLAFEDYSPVEFFYCLSGQALYKNNENDEPIEIEPYQSVILNRQSGESNTITFKKGIRQNFTIIHLERKKFLKNRSEQLSGLNKRLIKLFADDNKKEKTEFFQITNLSLADDVEKMQAIQYDGLAKVLYLDGLVHQFLYKKLIEHDKTLSDTTLNSKLRKNELETIRKVAQRIIDEPAKTYNLKDLSKECGLSQIKLQEGFKLLYARTVNDFIRHTRLKNAKKLLHNPDYNISEIVYAVGLSSRSYFSKIFKEKFGIKPSEYKARL